MPYTICVNVPGTLPESDPYAVITLEDAREAAADEIKASGDASEMFDLFERAHALPEEGGVIGPMPNGYIIDVSRVTWEEIARLAGFNVKSDSDPIGEFGTQAILDEYNGA